MNKEFATIAQNFKRRIAGNFLLVDGALIKEKILGDEFCVTKKLDGVLQIIFFRGGEVSAYSSNGNEQKPLPCLEEFGNLCKKAGLKSATIAAELYAPLSKTGRERVGDVSTAIASCPEKLMLAPFEIIDIDGDPYQVDYKERLAKLASVFSGDSIRVVESKTASNKVEVEQIFDEWVIKGGAEGIVVHSEHPFVYKIKERHTVDAVIIGYTVADDDKECKIRDLLTAGMTEDGKLQVLFTPGSGFSEKQRVELYEKLSAMVCPSEYVQSDSRNVAFQMVRPEVVAEFSVLDFVAENTQGEPKKSMLLEYDPSVGYKVFANVASASAHNPTFERIREDKSCNPVDIRISQVTDICPFSVVKPLVLSGFPKSEMLLRRVFTKGAGEKLMVQKYVVWKTNKEDTGLFPAYVFHYTDFSCSRKDPLKRDLRVSSSKEQIMELCDTFIAENVKKGWEEKV